MAMRFGKRVKVAKGVTLYVGKTGVSTRVGGQNAGVTLSRKGVHSTVSAPGTGLSWRTKIADAAPDDAAPQLPQDPPQRPEPTATSTRVLTTVLIVLVLGIGLFILLT